MHDTGSHTSGGDTSYASHSSHASPSPADGQAGWPQFTSNAADPPSDFTGNYTGAGAGRRRGPSVLALMILLSAILPVAFLIISLYSH